MKLIPYQKFSIQTDYNTELVKQKLERVTSKSAKNNSQNSKLFSGEIGDRSFKISRILFYRNSFNPIIKGEISNCASGAEVTVSMGLPKVVIVFLAIWCTMDLAIMLFAIANTVVSGEFDTFFIFGLFSLIFAYGFALLGFNKEAELAKEGLTQTLK